MDTTTSIVALYDVFSGYPLRERIDGCPCCVPKSAQQPLHSKPLKDLAWPDVDFYLFKAMTTFGDADDFRHFLPRIIELFVTDLYGCGYDFNLFLSKLEYANWEQWRENEREAIVKSIETWLESLDPAVEDSIFGGSKHAEIMKNIASYESWNCLTKGSK